MWSAPETEGPKYRRIAASLRERLRSGEYSPGELLPTHPELGEQYGVSLITIRQAVRLLVEEGLLKTTSGKGTVATSRMHRNAPLAASRLAHRVGVLLPYVAAWNTVHPALFAELHGLGNDVLVKPMPVGSAAHASVASEPDRARFELDALRDTCGGGLILFGDRWLVETFLRERRPDEPAVCLGNSTGIPPGLPQVNSDNFGGTFEVTRHLLSLGHTRIAYVDFSLAEMPESMRMLPGTNAERRRAGYRAALRGAAGLAPCAPPEFLELLWGAPDPERLGHLARRPDMPTAIVCWNDWNAELVYERLAEAGVSVPEEISMAGYDNTSELRGGNWLTSLDQNGAELARQLVRMLHEERERLVERRDHPAAHLLVPPTLHIRDSVAPPPARGGHPLPVPL